MNDGCWELIITLHVDDADDVRTRVLQQLESMGLAVVEGLATADEVAQASWQQAALMVYFATELEAQACAASFATWRSAQTQVRFLSTASWSAVWANDLQSFATARFYVTTEKHASKNTQVIQLCPSEAFGDGRHVTTRVNLALLDEVWAQRTPASFLDVGCGNGVLAIAAAKLGVHSVAATDVVEEAIAATRDNAALNAVRIDVRLDENPDDSRRWDCIAANIPAAGLIPLLPAIRRCLKTNGDLVVAGFFSGDAVGVINAAAAHGLQLQQEKKENDWVALHFNI